MAHLRLASNQLHRLNRFTRQSVGNGSVVPAIKVQQAGIHPKFRASFKQPEDKIEILSDPNSLVVCNISRPQERRSKHRLKVAKRWSASEQHIAADIGLRIRPKRRSGPSTVQQTFRWINMMAIEHQKIIGHDVCLIPL